MGCGCGGGRGSSRVAPKLPTTSNVAPANLHPNVQMVQNIQRLADERRKVERLKREQLIKSLLRP